MSNRDSLKLDEEVDDVVLSSVDNDLLSKVIKQNLVIKSIEDDIERNSSKSVTFDDEPKTKSVTRKSNSKLVVYGEGLPLKDLVEKYKGKCQNAEDVELIVERIIPLSSITETKIKTRRTKFKNALNKAVTLNISNGAYKEQLKTDDEILIEDHVKNKLDKGLTRQDKIQKIIYSAKLVDKKITFEDLNGKTDAELNEMLSGKTEELIMTYQASSLDLVGYNLLLVLSGVAEKYCEVSNSKVQLKGIREQHEKHQEQIRECLKAILAQHSDIINKYLNPNTTLLLFMIVNVYAPVITDNLRSNQVEEK